MYSVEYTTRFKQSFKRCLKRGLNPQIFEDALSILKEKGCLPESYLPHKLHGQFNGCWECHLQPDWLLIWKQNNQELTLLLVDTGTHSDLF